jgi:hypothetical protein
MIIINVRAQAFSMRLFFLERSLLLLEIVGLSEKYVFGTGEWCSHRLSSFSAE